MTNAEALEDNRKLRARCVQLIDQLNALQQEVDSLKASQAKLEARSPREYDDDEVCHVPLQFCDRDFRHFIGANKFVPFTGMAMVKENCIEIHKDNPLQLR